MIRPFRPVAAARGMYRFLFEESGFLIVGTLAALYAATAHKDWYHATAHPLEFFVNDVLMAAFFFMAAKEIRESMLPEGPLSSLKTAALPLLATAGGVLGPALLFILGSQIAAPHLTGAWAVPTATDIAFSYLAARFILGAKSPAIPFLLLLAVADDGVGLIILAVAYPTKAIEPMYLGFALIGIMMSLAFWKVFRLKEFWWYFAVPAPLMWYGFFQSGIHPALALVPLAFSMPHEHTDIGLFAEEENETLTDPLNQAARWLKNPVAVVLAVFGFVNAGVHIESLGVGTWLVSGALIVGKPLGIVLFTLAGLRFGLSLPEGMDKRVLLVTGMIAGIGFTVALFVVGIATQPGIDQDHMKVGALLSFGSAILAFATARMLGIRRVTT